MTSGLVWGITYKSTALYKICENGDFWTLSESRLLEVIKESFPAELNRLKRADASPRGGIEAPATTSISVRLFGEDFPEINRTLVGVLALRWIYHDDHQTLIGSQPRAVALQHASFAWLRDIFLTHLESSENLYLLILSVVINDLGKDPQLATDYARVAKVHKPHANHDIILYLAVQAGMVDALQWLPEGDRARVVAGLKLGASFNFGQLAQAENAPASLQGLREMRDCPDAFDLHFLEQILDLSGASGHEDWTCARKLIEPILQSYKTVYETAEAIISGRWDLQQGYDAVLRKKGQRVQEVGFSRSFDLSNDKDRTVLRLFCLGNVSDRCSAQIFWDAFHDQLPPDRQGLLVTGLNRFGRVGEPAVQPTYMPAMFSKALAVAKDLSDAEKVSVIVVLMDYLAEVLQVSPHEVDDLPSNTTVIERDVRVIEGVIKKGDFVKNLHSYRKILKEPQYRPTPSVANRLSGP